MGNREHFNEPQKSRLLASTSYTDRPLIDIEQILSASSSPGLPKYKNPLSPAQIRVVRDYIKRIRQQLVSVLTGLDVALPEPCFDSTHSIRVTLQFIEVALEEIAPEKLTGYGSVPQSLIAPLAGGIQEVKGIVRQLDSYVSQTFGADLGHRIGQLPQTDGDTDLLKQLGTIVERHNLVEFRAPLAHIIEKMATPAYEIAFFGRVSAGKSSLLNRIMGRELLPTGVTPVTAVPTRIKNGPASKLRVWTADNRVAEYDASRLADFVTESKNPGNQQHVTRLLLEIPLPVLPDEVILVDTPGLGSLALEGATETLAYLPRCDLGIVLIDGSSSIHSDDVATVDALRSASVPPLVVLSKIDLVPQEERGRLEDYTREQLRYQFGTYIEVAPLSSRPEMSALLDDWVSQQIRPRAADAKRLSRESNHRKLRSLSRRVLSALDRLSARESPQPSHPLSEQLNEAEDCLRRVASQIDVARERCFAVTDRTRSTGGFLVDQLAEEAVSHWRSNQLSSLDRHWIESHVNQFAQREGASVAQTLQATSKELTHALDKGAHALSIGEPEDHLSLETLVKELPAMDFQAMGAHIDRPILLSASSILARAKFKLVSG